MSTKIGAAGAMSLLFEHLGDPALPCRQVRLQTSPDGKTLLMVDIDQRKAGTLRTVCYEITPAELIAAIRAHGTELPQNSDEAIAAVEAMQRTSLLGAAALSGAAASPSSSLYTSASTSTSMREPVPASTATLSGTGTSSFADVPAVSA